MPTVEVIETKDRSSGRYHKRYAETQRGFDAENPLHTARRLLVDERCNLDSAGAYDVETPPAGVDPNLLCKWCYPQGNVVSG